MCRNMVAAVDVEINDFGLDDIIGNTQELNGRVVKVGIQGGSHDDMVDIAIYNHFGTRHIPARPFMADCAEQNAAQISEAQRRVVYRVLEGADVDAMLHQLGNWYRDVQRAHIRHGNWVPNAPATIRRKGSDRPLIDTGQLVNAVEYEVG